ncbi:MAG: hypothetical protein KHZ15_07695 [Coprobacillus cateniformis]|uniref:hypothetical protein n=1 Tax=Longibaculum muris TaxID=1796628 RepID=UPI003AB38026|nr:hypothetical protein [Coprobacillus cateniformis]
MVCSLIGAFLLVYVAVITFMNILGYPLSKFMLDYQYPFLSLHKNYLLAFIIQLCAMLTLLQAGHIIGFILPVFLIQILCIFLSIFLSIITLFYWYSPDQEKRFFMAPLLSLITLCFYLTIFNTY